jgi:hypothetical protein
MKSLTSRLEKLEQAAHHTKEPPIIFVEAEPEDDRAEALTRTLASLGIAYRPRLCVVYGTAADFDSL